MVQSKFSIYDAEADYAPLVPVVSVFENNHNDQDQDQDGWILHINDAVPAEPEVAVTAIVPAPDVDADVTVSSPTRSTRRSVTTTTSTLSLSSSDSLASGTGQLEEDEDDDAPVAEPYINVDTDTRIEVAAATLLFQPSVTSSNDNAEVLNNSDDTLLLLHSPSQDSSTNYDDHDDDHNSGHNNYVIEATAVVLLTQTGAQREETSHCCGGVRDGEECRWNYQRQEQEHHYYHEFQESNDCSNNCISPCNCCYCSGCDRNEEITNVDINDKRRTMVASGVASAALGMIFCGPLGALLLGFGAAYAVENKPDGNGIGDSARAIGEIALSVSDAVQKIKNKHKVSREQKELIQQLEQNHRHTMENCVHDEDKEGNAFRQQPQPQDRSSRSASNCNTYFPMKRTKTVIKYSWKVASDFVQKHKILDKGLNSIGMGVCWVAEKIVKEVDSLTTKTGS